MEPSHYIESISGVAVIPNIEKIEIVLLDQVEHPLATVFVDGLDFVFRQQIFQVFSPSAPTKWTSIREGSNTGVLSASEVSTTIDDGTNPNFGRGVNMLNFGA